MILSNINREPIRILAPRQGVLLAAQSTPAWEVLRRTVKGWRYDVITANDGAEAEVQPRG